MRNQHDDRERESEEETVYGLRAALAVFETRKDDITRIAYSRALLRDREIAELLGWAKKSKVPHGEATDRDLARVSQSEHHEGLAVLAAPRKFVTPQALATALVQIRGAAIALDRVRNPYNVGAVLRTCAFFGLYGAIVGAPAPHPALSPQAVRVAEGGAEHLAIARTTDLGETLAHLKKAGVRVIGADGASKKDVNAVSFAGPVVIVMGNEREGLAPRVRDRCDEIVALRGSGRVESLNVGVAAGILIERAARAI